MSEDLEVEPGLSVGAWLLREISANAVIEEEPWALERVARISARFDVQRPGRCRFQVVIPWLRALIAFTAPGPYIFFSRRLYERCPDDDTTAFVIAHEIAHHDLGHMALFPDWMARLARIRGSALVVATVRGVERRLYGPDRECDADEYALQLCAAAGYDPLRCLEFFRIAEQFYLDLGDTGAVFGPDESDEELAPDAPWLTKARIWTWQRTHGYLPVRDRVARLRHFWERTASTARRPA